MFIMDLYARKIVLWVLSDTLEAKHVVKAVEKAKKEEECGETIDSAYRPGNPICAQGICRSNDRDEEKVFEKSVSMG